MTPEQQELLRLRDVLRWTRREIAEHLGISQGAVKDRLERARKAQAREALSGGIQDALERTGIDPSNARFGYRRIKDEDGSFNTVFWRMPAAEQTSLAERIRDTLSELPALPRITPPKRADKDLLNVIPIADAHIGMMAWGGETGEDYDTDKAARRVMEWVGKCVDAAPSAQECIILDVGDLTHADDQSNQTPRSKHGLDVDTRHYRTVETTIAALASSIEYAAQKHRKVRVRILPGNHNPHAYLAVLFALKERYRASSQIEVEAEPGEFWVHEHGKVMLCAHHGDKADANRLAHFMADEFAEIWGRTKHRFLFTGHLHHKKAQDIGGIEWEQLRALSARDAHAYSNAYSARAALQALTFHREAGKVQSFHVSAYA